MKTTDPDMKIYILMSGETASLLGLPEPRAIKYSGRISKSGHTTLVHTSCGDAKLTSFLAKLTVPIS
jgi:hypothetical protein